MQLDKGSCSPAWPSSTVSSLIVLSRMEQKKQLAKITSYIGGGGWGKSVKQAGFCFCVVTPLEGPVRSQAFLFFLSLQLLCDRH